ncbi:MAG: hypothetical protein ACRDS0_36675, partial [Pseudonocardiaceae bacterium]
PVEPATPDAGLLAASRHQPTHKEGMRDARASTATWLARAGEDTTVSCICMRVIHIACSAPSTGTM